MVGKRIREVQEEPGRQTGRGTWTDSLARRPRLALKQRSRTPALSLKPNQQAAQHGASPGIADLQRRCLPAGRVSKSRLLRIHALDPLPMDIERINQIGGLLADLTARTGPLRGYL